MVTPSIDPSSIAFAITDAVWNPPAQRTGTSTSRLTALARSRLMPSTPSLRTRRPQAHAKPLLMGGVRNMR